MFMEGHSQFIRLLIYLYSTAILFAVAFTILFNLPWNIDAFISSSSNSSEFSGNHHIIATRTITTITTTVSTPHDKRVKEELSNRTRLTTVSGELPNIKNYEELSKDAKINTVGIPDKKQDKDALPRSLLTVKEALSNRTLLTVGDELPRIRNYQELSEEAKMMLSEEHYNRYLALIRGFVNLFESHGVEYIMADGTLLGAYVMHDIIAWDDDVDILVSYEDYPKLKKLYQKETFQETFSVHGYHDSIDEWALENLDTIYTDRHKNKSVWHKHKIYFANEEAISKSIKWKWPFVDIKFYKKTDKYVYNYDHGIRTENLLEDFYPIVKRPFAGLWLPSPKRADKYLHSKYKTFKCKSSGWDHQHEKGRKESNKIKHECSDLSNGMYPSVEHIPYGSNYTVELVSHQMKVKYAVVINAPSETYVKPYVI